MKANKTKAIAGILCAGLFTLSACGPLVELPGDGPAPALYTLSDAAAPRDLGLSIPAKLFIEDLGGDAFLDTNRIAVRIGATEVKYLPLARWTDAPQYLIREKLQATLEDISGLTALGAKALEVPTDYRLKLRLRAFNAVENGGRLNADVQISAILVSAQGSEIIGTNQFSAQSESASSSAKDIVSALDAANQDVIQDISLWVINVIGETS